MRWRFEIINKDMELNKIFSHCKQVVLNILFRFKLSRNKRKHKIQIKIHKTEFETYHTYIIFYFAEADTYVTKQLEYCSFRYKKAKMTNIFGN